MQTEDGAVGHVQDIRVDVEAWVIRYLLVDTMNRRFGKRVLVAPAWLTHVSVAESKTFFSIACSMLLYAVLHLTGVKGIARRYTTTWRVVPLGS